MIHSYLNSFTNFESRLQYIHPQSFDIKRVQHLFHALGNPQKNLKFIHVAGTKGKGSTCAFIAYILRAAGYRVGLYTSPHLYRINERIRILDLSSDIKKDFCGSISDGELAGLVKSFRPQIDQLGELTYFEVLTGLALCHFARQKTDIVILETGLGGRLDATNVVNAVIDVITPISFDHRQQLGRTLEKIAFEKAAIIKDLKSKVVIGPQPRRAMTVIQKRCRAFDIKPVIVHHHLKSVRPPLAGAHQLSNAAIAVAVVELLSASGFKISKNAIACGIRQTRWPGRFEFIGKSPAVIIDCAHNPASAQALLETFRQKFPGKKCLLILGVSEDKDIPGICNVLNKMAHTVIVTQSKHPRAYHFKKSDLKKLFQNQTILDAADTRQALGLARRYAGKNDVIVAAGSVFIAAEVRALFQNVSA